MGLDPHSKVGTRPPRRRWWVCVLQLLAGASLMVGAGFAIRTIVGDLSARNLPQGWLVIRPPHEVSALAIQGDTIWAGGKDGLYAIDRQSGTLLPRPADAPPIRYVSDLLLDSHDRLWIAHQRGVSIYAAEGWRSLSEAEGLLPGPAKALWEDRQGAVWIGGEAGVVRYDGQAFASFTMEDGLGLPSVDVIVQDSQGLLWFGSSSPTHGGLSRYDGSAWVTFPAGAVLIHPSVNDIIETTDGALWVATGFASRGGAMRLKDGEWTSLTTKEGLAGEKVRSLFQDRDGRLWFGSEYNGVAVTDGSKWVILTPDDGVADLEVKEMVQDTDGVYWLGTADGVSRIERIAWTTIMAED